MRRVVKCLSLTCPRRRRVVNKSVFRVEADNFKGLTPWDLGT
jgi:hypothetical protein